MKTIKNFFIGIKDKIVALFKRRNPMEIFVFLMAVSIGIYAIGSLIYFLCGGTLWSTVFFHGCGDAFMDFFNSMRDVHQGAGVYTDRHVIYPPLANVLFLLFSFMMPEKYLNSEFMSNELLGNANNVGRYTWINYTASSIAIILFSVLIFAILFAVVKSEIKLKNKIAVLFLIFVMISSPVAYSIERGNILLICVATITYFLFNYKSKSKFKKEMALICLAIAINIKIYPIVFGMFLLQEKDWKAVLRCALYTIILLIVPSFLFGGPACLIQLVKNLLSFSDVGELPLFLAILNYAKYPLYLFICGWFIYLIVTKKFPLWKTSAITLCMLLCNLSTHSIYMWPFMIAPFIMFMREEKLEGINWLYFIFFTLPFMYWPNFYIPSFYEVDSPLMPNVILLVGQVGFLLVALIETFKKPKKEQPKLLNEEDTDKPISNEDKVAEEFEQSVEEKN